MYLQGNQKFKSLSEAAKKVIIVVVYPLGGRGGKSRTTKKTELFL